MMIKPGITELSRCVDSRYTLVSMAAKRARMIGEKTEEKDGEFITAKPVSIAADEIAQGKIGYVRSRAIKAAEEFEAEKAAAILSYNEAQAETDTASSEDTDGAEEEREAEEAEDTSADGTEEE